MSKIYITTDNNNKVMLIHNMPFDSQYGLHQTEQELLKTGYLVDSVPEYDTTTLVDKIPILYYNGTEFYWELVDRPLSKEEEILKELQLKQNELIIETDYRLLLLENNVK